jgi:hypothetical protein
MPIRPSLPLLAATFVATHPAAGLAQDAAEGTSIGGYGEVHYSNHAGPRTPGEVTFKRFVIYLAHAVSDRLSLRSEFELEDARLESGSASGEVALEQAYLDYRLGEAFTLRAGLILVPLGILNETHEPPTFNGVARPDFDHDVLPTTWRELGAGVFGNIPGVTGVSFRLYLLNGLRAEGFTAAEGIREGRQEGQKASFANPSLTGRLEYGRPGIKLGAAFWYGGTADQDSVLGEGTFDAPLAVVAADGRYDVGALQFRGEFGTIHVGDAQAINRRYGSAVGSRITGGYLEGAVNLLRSLAPASRQKLMLFVRHERFDTHASVPSGTPRDPALARRITTFGVSYKPVWNVVFKGDYQLRRNRAAQAQDEVLALGMGYQF